MLLDIEQRENELIVSYYNREGKVDFKRYPISQFENWVDGDRFNDTLNGFFELNVNYMVPSINETTITPQNKKSGENYILGQLQKPRQS